MRHIPNWHESNLPALLDYQTHRAAHDEDETDMVHTLQSLAKLSAQNAQAERTT